MKNLVKKTEIVVNHLPYIIVLFLLIIVPPIGVWFLVIKITNDKKEINHSKRLLLGFGLFSLILIGILMYSHIKNIIQLYDSGMSLDMINFIPKNIYLYIIGIIMCISYMKGSIILGKYSKIEQEYIKAINIEHITSIKKISNKLNIPIDLVKLNIKALKDKNYLVKLEVDEEKNKLIYKDIDEDEINVDNKRKFIQCSKCGAIIQLKKDEYVECDFCGEGLIDKK